MQSELLYQAPRQGMGCWAIGGPFFAGESSLGWGKVDDAESVRAVHAAYDAGIRIFDTAAVYGAGHSEHILGQALANKSECLIITKAGLAFDEQSKQVVGEDTNAANILPAIDASLRRLQRDTIDVLLLHLNELPIAQAEPLFAAMELAREQGKIRAYGWSTDYPGNVDAFATQAGFQAVEHAMNLFVDVPTIQKTIEEHDLTPLIRSPLAMGVLTGKYTQATRFPSDDNRSRDEAWKDYFVDCGVAPIYLQQLDSIKECLSVGGRSLAQGALGWLMAKSERNIPLPGARTAAQVIENAAALEFGPLPANAMAEIETLIQRTPEGEARSR